MRATLDAVALALIVVGTILVIARRWLAATSLGGRETITAWYGSTSIDGASRTYLIMGLILGLIGIARLIGWLH